MNDTLTVIEPDTGEILTKHTIDMEKAKTNDETTATFLMRLLDYEHIRREEKKRK